MFKCFVCSISCYFLWSYCILPQCVVFCSKFQLWAPSDSLTISALIATQKDKAINAEPSVRRWGRGRRCLFKTKLIPPTLVLLPVSFPLSLPPCSSWDQLCAHGGRGTSPAKSSPRRFHPAWLVMTPCFWGRSFLYFRSQARYHGLSFHFQISLTLA